MKKGLIIAEHLTISLTVLVFLLGTIAASFSLLENFWINPGKYFLTNLPAQEIQLRIVSLLIITASVLAAYIIYLLLASKTRTEILVLKATKSLSELRERFEKLYESAPVPYLTLNKKGDVTRANKAALRFFGLTEPELMGKHFFDCRADEDREKMEKIKGYYHSDVPTDREEIRIIAKNGEERWVLLSVFEITGLEAKEKTGLASVFDITERKKLDQAKTEFVSLASHQLRTPVATIKWYIESMLLGTAGDLPPKQRDYLERMYRSNKDMIELIEMLLNVSRIEIGKLKPDISIINVAALCESVIEELSAQITKKNLAIEKNYGDQLSSVESDPKLLRIVIQNIFSNAVKYTRDGGVIGIEFGSKSISIYDNGIGIPKEDQEKIFSKLYRASNATSIENSHGTGLGLYLVKSIMETLGGDIRFQSEEGRGSLFTIEL